MGGLVSLLRRGEVRVPYLDPGVYSRSSPGGREHATENAVPAGKIVSDDAEVMPDAA
jgi:hypothetical protein